MELTGKRIGFLGDSITAGSGASSIEKCYVSLFSKAHKDCQVYNYGMSGTRIAPNNKMVEPAFEHPFEERLSAMEDNLDVVVVFGGTNDFGHGDAPMGKFGDTNRTSFYGAYYSLLFSIENKYPKAKIIVLTPIHRFNEDVPAIKPDGGHVLLEYVNAIRETAEYFAIPVLDLWKVSGIQPNIEISRITYTADGLHPNDYGYTHLFNLIDSYLKNL